MRFWGFSLLLLAGCWLPQSVVREKIHDVPGADDTLDSVDGVDTPAIDTDAPPDTVDTPDPVDTIDTPEVDTEPSACWDAEIPSGATGLTLAGDNTNRGDDHASTCTPFEGGQDLAWSWEVPQTGCYVFSTAGSGFDSVLYLLDGCQDELVCNDDVAYELGEYSSEVHAQLSADQVVTVVVDGYDADAVGDVSLSFWQGEDLAYDVDAGFLEGLLYTGSNSGQDTTLSFGSTDDCSDDGGRDVLIRWQASGSGVFRFSVSRADFDTVLSVHRPCDTEAFRCTDAARPVLGGNGLQEEIDMTLDLGEVVILRVAGARFLGAADTGTFDLRVRYIEP